MKKNNENSLGLDNFLDSVRPFTYNKTIEANSLFKDFSMLKTTGNYISWTNFHVEELEKYKKILNHPLMSTFRWFVDDNATTLSGRVLDNYLCLHHHKDDTQLRKKYFQDLWYYYSPVSENVRRFITPEHRDLIEQLHNLSNVGVEPTYLVEIIETVTVTVEREVIVTELY